MKTLALFLGFSLAALTSIHRSATAQGFDRLGIKGGIGVANFYGNDIKDTERRTGLSLGGFVAYSFNRNLALRLEVLYAQKGATLTGGNYDFIKYTLDYIDIPLLLQYSLPTEGQVRLNLCIGPTLAILYSARSAGQWSGLLAQPKEFIDAPRTTDMGVVFGAGVEFNIDGQPLMLEGRLGLGLSTIDTGERTSFPAAPSGADIRTSTISLMVAYSFWR